MAPAMAAPSLMSMRRDHPRHITGLPGGGSEARARKPPSRANRAREPEGGGGGRMGATGEEAPEPGDPGQVARERRRRAVAWAAGYPIEQAYLAFGQGEL